ncbi:MAG: ribonuclease P protein component [Spirochaetes bacterium]|nr:ribonuclease P protein component [Spirochaetota bacterium]
MKRSLTRQERLRGASLIQEVLSSGQKVGCPGAKLLFRENGLPYTRVVFIPTRKVRTAVERNRTRRLGKEAFRQVKQGVKAGYDLAFILYPGEFTYEERFQQISSLLGKAGLLQEHPEGSG